MLVTSAGDRRSMTQCPVQQHRRALYYAVRNYPISADGTCYTLPAMRLTAVTQLRGVGTAATPPAQV